MIASHKVLRKLRIRSLATHFRLHSANIQTNVNNKSWGFETSPYSDWSEERVLIEKSIRNGCRAIVSQSSMLSTSLGENDTNALNSLFELIQDLHLTEEIELNDIYFIHRLRSKYLSKGPLSSSFTSYSSSSSAIVFTEKIEQQQQQQNQQQNQKQSNTALSISPWLLSDWKKEIELIHTLLTPRPLNLITLPATLIMLNSNSSLANTSSSASSSASSSVLDVSLLSSSFNELISHNDNNKNSFYTIGGYSSCPLKQHQQQPNSSNTATIEVEEDIQTKLGLDFSTELLFSISNDQFQLLKNNFINICNLTNNGAHSNNIDTTSSKSSNSNSNSNNSTNNITFPQRISSITVAFNCFTYHRAIELIQLAHSLHISVITTEVLRIHYRRPGYCTPGKAATVKSETESLNASLNQKLLLHAFPSSSSPYNTSLLNANSNNSKNSTNSSGNSGDKNSTTDNNSGDNNTSAGNNAKMTALELLQKSLDSCLKLEKQYLSKFGNTPSATADRGSPNEKEAIVTVIPSPVVHPSHVCWAHNLLQTFPKAKSSSEMNTNNISNNVILFLEEWNFMLRNKIQPVLEGAMKAVKASDTGGEDSVEDWCVLYKPLATVMFRAYSAALQDRKKLMCEEILKSLQQQQQQQAVIINANILKEVEDVPLAIGLLVATSCDSSVISSNSTSSSSADNNNRSNLTICLVDTELTELMYEELNTITTNTASTATNNNNNYNLAHIQEVWSNMAATIKSFNQE